jgi:hypothetical protein
MVDYVAASSLRYESESQRQGRLGNLANKLLSKICEVQHNIMFMLKFIWLPGTDYSALRASPSGSPFGRSPPLRGVVEPGLFHVGGSNWGRSVGERGRC